MLCVDIVVVVSNINEENSRERRKESEREVKMSVWRV
jgi:hypothetical protein